MSTTKRNTFNFHSRVSNIVPVSIVCLVMSLLSSVRCAGPAISVTGVSTNTASGLPTSMSTIHNCRLSDPQDALGGMSIHTCATRGSIFKTFDKNAAMLMTLPDSGIRYAGFALKDPLKLLITKSYVDLAIYYTYDPTTYALTQVATVQTLTDDRYCVDNAGTDMVYCTGSYYVIEYSISGSSLLRPRQYTMASTATSKGIMLIPYTDSIFTFQLNNWMIKKRSDFSTIKSVTTTTTAYDQYYAEVDNLNTNSYLYSSVKYTTSSSYTDANGVTQTTTNYYYRLYKVDMTIATTATSYVYYCDYSSYGDYNNVLNFGPYQYVVTMPYENTDVRLLIYNKLGSSCIRQIMTVSTTLTPYEGSFTGMLFDEPTMRMYFGFVVSASYYNFQSYYLTVDRCVNRDGASVCLECLPGYYRQGTAANNLCSTTAELPAGYGIVVGTTPALADVCTSTGCTDCFQDRLICTTCNTATLYYLNGTACVAKASIAVGWGINGGVLSLCTETGCTNCKDSHAACVACNTATLYYKNGTSCIAKANIANGWGINGANLAACTASNCINCKDNFGTCIACDTASQFYLKDNACIAKANIAVGWGINGGALTACTSVGCTNCIEIYTTCVTCNVGSLYYLNGTVCVAKANIANGWGINGGALAACTTTNCINCKENHVTCVGCNVASQYYLKDNDCIAKANIAAGWGINGGSLAACTASNCINCKENSATCVTCDTASQFYLKDNACIAKANIAVGWGINGGALAACTSVGCTNCVDSYTTCVTCNVGSLYYLNGTVCVAKANIANGWGINGGALAACTTTNCINCKENHVTCVGCNVASQYYLKDNTCIAKANIAAGWGISGGSLVACSDPNCINCRDNFAICVACDVASLFYLQGTVCIAKALIPPRWGITSSQVALAPCSDPNCLLCVQLNTVCTYCDKDQSYYLDSDNTCMKIDDVTDGFGINTITNKIEACDTSLCTNCLADKTICSACNQMLGYFLLKNMCFDPVNAPPHYGANNITNEWTECTQGTACFDCKLDYRICDRCHDAKGYYMMDGLCIHKSAIADGFGIDKTLRTVVQCTDANCVKCVDNYQICTECDQANGYILVNGSCAMPVTFTITESPAEMKSDTVDFSFLLKADRTVDPGLLAKIESALKMTVTFNELSTNTKEQLETKTTLKSAGTALTFIVEMRQTLKREDYSVMVVPQKSPLLLKFTILWLVKIGDISVPYKNPMTVADKVKTEQQATAVSSITSFSTADSPTGNAVATAMAADPTGTFFRFTKILQIVNKLYFININYGKRLEAFLATSVTKNAADPDTKRPQKVYNSRSTRGKLTNKDVSLDVFYIMKWKMVAYLISVALQVFKRFLLDNCIMGKVGIYFCHYANKVHLIIFNLVFIDFIWLAPRTLMHSRGLPNYKIYLPTLTMLLIAADLCLILAHLLDDRIWRKALEHYTARSAQLCLDEQNRKLELTKLENKDNSELKQIKQSIGASCTDRPNQPQTKQINYKRTYFEIDFNVHLMDMAVMLIRVDPTVFANPLSRSLLLNFWLKVPILQLTILSCQYANSLGLVALLMYELARLIATIYAYLKYKYLKNIICLLMEVNGSLPFIFFYCNALLISPKRFDEIILDFYQDAGIWIVIASCVAEYLLLLTYIGVAAYDFFKNRKMMKKMNIKPVYSLIHYDIILPKTKAATVTSRQVIPPLNTNQTKKPRLRSDRDDATNSKPRETKKKNQNTGVVPLRILESPYTNMDLGPARKKIVDSQVISKPRRRLQQRGLNVVGKLSSPPKAQIGNKGGVQSNGPHGGTKSGNPSIVESPDSPLKPNNAQSSRLKPRRD